MGSGDNLGYYSTACSKVASDYIELSTRFSVKDVRIAAARPTVREFSIRIRHDIEVVADARDYHGKHLPGANDFATADWNWYQEQVDAQTRAEYARPETLDDLIASVTNRPYAAIAERTRIRTHPRQFFHTYVCNGCSGAGTVSCHSCGGCGRVACGRCHGSGRINCHHCHGSGTVTEHRTVTDYNGHSRSETQIRSCGHCSGGRIGCFSCGSSGKQQCGTCGGTGRLTCSACSGHGCLTKVTATHTYTCPRFSGHYPAETPDYVHEALCKAGFPSLALHGQITFRQVVEDRDNSAVEFVYDCTMPFCELDVEVKGIRSRWVLFGNEPQIFDAGGALEALLKNDFEQLRSTANGQKRWLPWFHASARKAVTPFMASELNQEIVKADTAGLTIERIFEQVNRSVSEIYIRDTLHNLQTSVKIAVHWSRVKWLLTFALLSPLFAVLASAYLHRSRPVDVFAAAPQLFIHLPNSSSIQWELGLLTVPFTLFGWFFARWMSLRWLKKSGGKITVAWARRRGLLLGKWTAITVIATAVGTTGAVFNRWPLWIDMSGKVYGRFALFPPPHVIEPLPANPHVTEKKRPTKKPSRKNAPRHAPAKTLEPPPEAPRDEPASDGPWVPTS